MKKIKNKLWREKMPKRKTYKGDDLRKKKKDRKQDGSGYEKWEKKRKKKKSKK